jgi:hypothetical protein
MKINILITCNKIKFSLSINTFNPRRNQSDKHFYCKDLFPLLNCYQERENILLGLNVLMERENILLGLNVLMEREMSF